MIICWGFLLIGKFKLNIDSCFIGNFDFMGVRSLLEIRRVIGYLIDFLVNL